MSGIASWAFIVFLVGIAAGCIIGWAGAAVTPTPFGLALGLSALTAVGTVLMLWLALRVGVSIGPEGVAVTPSFGRMRNLPWPAIQSFGVGPDPRQVAVVSNTGESIPLGFNRETEEMAKMFAASLNLSFGLTTEGSDTADFFQTARELARPLVAGDRVLVHSSMGGTNPYGTIVRFQPDGRAVVRIDWSGREHSCRTESLSLTTLQDENPVKRRGLLLTALRWYMNLPGGRQERQHPNKPMRPFFGT
jgi:hypothetical protein